MRGRSKALSSFRLTVVSLALVVGASQNPAELRAAQPPREAARPTTSSAADNGKAIVRLPARDGKVAKADLLAELGQVAGLDLHAIEWLLPDGQLDLTRPKVPRRLAWVNRALGRYAEVRIARADGNREMELVIEIDRARLHSDKRRAKTKARQVSLKVLDPRGKVRSRQEYGLKIDGRAVKQGTHDLLIVGIHGYSASARAMDAFLDPLRDDGLPCASFVYPNDQPIADSARLLSDELKELARREPSRRVALLTFSMGGLVARAAIEDPKLDPGNVERLVMIAPPNQGAVCARFARGFDLYEHLVRERQFAPRTLLAASIMDGLGEARQDLCPGSRFLRELNARPRNRDVRYSIFMGDRSELDAEQVERMIAALDKLERTSTLVRIFGPKLDRLRGELAELAEPNDGFVTVRRGRLAGVEDVEVLSFGHVERFADPANRRVQALQRAIALRLE